MLTLTTYSTFFFFNDTATTEIYTLSLHDALPIFHCDVSGDKIQIEHDGTDIGLADMLVASGIPQEDIVLRSEEHTSELQSQSNLVCRLLLEKKKKEHLDITTKTTNAIILNQRIYT